MAQSARTPGPPLSAHPATTVSHSSFKPTRSRNKHQVPTPFHGLDLAQNESCPDEFLHSQAPSECLPGPGSAPDQKATERVPALPSSPPSPDREGQEEANSHHSGAGRVPAPALCSGAQESAADGPGKPSQEGATGTAAVQPPPLPMRWAICGDSAAGLMAVPQRRQMFTGQQAELSTGSKDQSNKEQPQQGAETSGRERN